MKKLVTLTALSLLLGIGVCSASIWPKHHKTNTNASKQVVSLIPLKGSRGFAIRVDKLMPGKSTVIVCDADGNTVLKDRLTEGTHAEKKYILAPDLENGKYSVEVFSKEHDIKTNFYIYTRGQRRIVDIM